MIDSTRIAPALRRGLFVASLVAVLPATGGEADAPAAAALKVCADPYMLPFSSQQEPGFENRIAELFAEKLNRTLQYEWFTWRMGFIRNTLKSQDTDGTYKCDLVLGVPDGFDLTANTRPYYTSTYLLVIARGRGFDDVVRPEMLGEAVKQGRTLRVGLTDEGPAQLWVFRNGLMGSMVPYLGQPGDPTVNPGEVLMRDIAADKIDAAVVWGPTAGYYARKLGGEAQFILLPLRDDPKFPDMRFEFSMAMGVRHGEDAWRKEIDALIASNSAAINRILEEYGVPLLPLQLHESGNDDD
jgi:quinoprotein dehydrogenase-associated probable ABC transporter substrate-binding protein